ncbi:RNA polymerase, sigma-24 subunit, ECF subfamily [Nitrospira sp. KM1]|uniref:sigma-70 family RNA polymerase sigma factor n=1 Tax=Nitrospira sp. KM1 TaxID=1936990 RepID=UPI0013A76C1E|nr:sigma-70 family RNA polymerase sigma factor [Nitrospira sp. KM1]BCA53827.1 RNA polymerase, sigma-24 subunit, ECF subfamily [Nitrospira sp. KM1]
MDEGLQSDPQLWVEQYGDYLFRCALLRVRDRAVAEDLVQETFLAALQSRDRFAGQSSERNWMIGILKHKIVDRFRKDVREQPAEDLNEFVRSGEDGGSFDQHGHWRLDQTAPMDWPDHPGNILERKQFWSSLEHCVAGLPPKMAQVFTLREVDEIESDVVCRMLNVSASNLWVLLHRARKQLRQCLEINFFGRREVH